MTKNANFLAMPFQEVKGITGGMITSYNNHKGLTKLELFCLHHGVPETGDPDLDSIIRKGNHQKAAMMAMQGILNNGVYTFADCAVDAVKYADALLAELEKKQ